ncbi:NUDIX hydrolase [Pseudoneobacillus sp. C159]
MDTELLKIFDENRNPVGTATREEVHKRGFWHEAFHCWFVRKEEEANFIYLQLRSHLKKDYPNLLDITAAGHLLAHETVLDGVREIKEEIGIDVQFEELVSLGIISYEIEKDNFIDKEFANVFLFKSNNHLGDFTLQEEEVSGIVKMVFDEFAELWLGERKTITIQGFKINQNGQKEVIARIATRDEFVQHEISYYKTVIEKIKEAIQ